MFTIASDALTDTEIALLIEQMKNFPHVGLLSHEMWRKFDYVYVTRSNNRLIGACAVVKLHNWIKIGPVIILSKYHNKGYGKKLLTKIVNDFRRHNLYIGSSNPAVIKIVRLLGFKKINNFFKLPKEIKVYLIKYFLERLNINFLLDDIRKKLFLKRGNYSYFIRLGN